MRSSGPVPPNPARSTSKPQTHDTRLIAATLGRPPHGRSPRRADSLRQFLDRSQDVPSGRPHGCDMTSRRTLHLRLAVLLALALALVAAGTATAATGVARDVSSNWAGYVVTGTTFSSVTGTWVQPELDCTTAGTSASAFWVGLGGNTDGSNTLEQAGTGAECKADGTASYYAWYELVPAPSVTIPLAVRPGDTITATVTVSGTKVTMQVTNVTTGKTVTKVKRTAAPDTSSAEWVAEAPSLCSGSGYCRTVTLSDFGRVKFTKASATSADGHTGSISDGAWTATSIELVADSGGPGYGRYDAYDAAASAIPTALSVRGTVFAVKWQGTSGSAAATAPPPPGGYYGFRPSSIRWQ